MVEVGLVIIFDVIFILLVRVVILVLLGLILLGKVGGMCIFCSGLNSVGMGVVVCLLRSYDNIFLELDVCVDFVFGIV